MTSLLHSSARALLFAGLIAILVQSAVAHTYLSSVYLNGAALVEGDCVRPHPASNYDSPITFLNQSDMTCGWLPQAAVPANRKCPIAAGATIGIQFHHVNDSASDNIIDPTHLGPVIVYLAKSDTGAGNVWFKIYEDGYTPADGKWAVDRLIANGGRVNVPLPSDIAPGNYLLRGEVIALHAAYLLDGVQPYVGCVELTVSGTGSSNPTGVAFPGFYHDTDPGMLFNLYAPFTSYIIPGPALYVSGSSSSSSGSATVAPTSAPTAAPTKAPTSAPTGAPTKVPTSAPSTPTSAPTSAPTTAPSAPTTAPNGNGNNIMLGLNGGSSVWWLGVIVSGGGETTVKVELADSSSAAAWTALIDMSYAYVYDKSIELQLPLSIRVTSSSGAQVVLTNVFTSLTTSTINTGKTYASTSTPTTAPTAAPTTRPTAAPTTRPTTAPTTRPTTAPTTRPTTAPTFAPTATPTHPTSPAITPTPSGAKTMVSVYPGSSEWWFALTVSGNSAAIASVQIMDAGGVTSFETMTTNAWGYSLSANGVPFVAPLTVRVTSVSGSTVTATIASLAPGSVSASNGQL